MPGDVPVFHHSGHLGDIIYALPVLRAFGGADLEISTQNPVGDPIKHPYRDRGLGAQAGIEL